MKRMQKIYPKKLQKGDQVRVIAPSRTLGLISSSVRELANTRLQDLGLTVSFGKHVEEQDVFLSSSVESRIEDLHEAFSDTSVDGILTVIGGFNCNQLLEYTDWDVIRENPKIFCGYSDITALNNAIYAKTGVVSYSSPHYSTFGQMKYFDYTLDYFQKCLMSEEPYEVNASSQWTDDPWWMDQEKRNPIANEGYWMIHEGKAEGTLLGANLCTLNLLQGTQYMPDLKGSLLFIEDDEESKPFHFDRDLQSLIHQPGFDGVRGIVIGRFQNASGMTRDLLTQIVDTKRQLQNIPIIANVDFGHTDPKASFPIGGTVSLEINEKHRKLTILEH